MAQSDQAPKPFPAQQVEEVLVPVPSEIFGVLKKLGQPDWKALHFAAEKHANFSGRPEVALLLGCVVADGFVAVEGADALSVESTGREVLKLSDALGIKDAVQPHCEAILDGAKSDQWEKVRVEFDKVQATAKKVMEERRDSLLAHCVSLGGWLRGTEVVTTVINKSYTADSADLLRQPDLVEHFLKSIKTLVEEKPNAKNFAKLKEGLESIHRLMQPESETPGEQEVDEINEITSGLVKAIRG